MRCLTCINIPLYKSYDLCMKDQVFIINEPTVKSITHNTSPDESTRYTGVFSTGVLASLYTQIYVYKYQITVLVPIYNDSIISENYYLLLLY